MTHPPTDGPVRIDRVTTRGGDAGQTALGDGSRVAKDNARVEAYGTVDEANAALGALRLHCADPLLARIQQDLFDVGADLCVPGADRAAVTQAAVARLDAAIAGHVAALPPLTSFVLPAGSAAVVAAHIARTTVRRAERRVVSLCRAEPVNPRVVEYLNRLSDYLFVLARTLDRAGGGNEALWAPAAVSPKA